MTDQLTEIAHRLTVVLERLTELHADAVADARALEDEDDADDDASVAGRDLAGRQIVIGGSIGGPTTLS